VGQGNGDSDDARRGHRARGPPVADASAWRHATRHARRRRLAPPLVKGGDGGAAAQPGRARPKLPPVGENVSFPSWVEPDGGASLVLRDVDGSVRRARALSFPGSGNLDGRAEPGGGGALSTRTHVRVAAGSGTCRLGR